MRSRRLNLLLSLVLVAACQSEIDDKTAALVTETGGGAAAPPTSTAPPPGATVSEVIEEKSSIEWVGAKVTRDHIGKFNDFSGYIQYAGGQPARIAFSIDLNTIESDTEKLTAHLKSADFFDVARFPEATFVSTSITEAPAGATPPGTTHMVNGVLNLHGVQKEVTIPATTQLTADGVRTMSEFTINRHEWGISYRGAADDLIKNDVLIRLNLFFPPPPAQA